jgi:DNA-binding NarL/FixJ family response regulator
VSLSAPGTVLWQNMPVPPSSPYQIELTDDERAELVARTRPSGQARMVLRARIVLAAADGDANTAIAQQQRVHVDTVRKWRARFWRRVGCHVRVTGLACGDAGRAGSVMWWFVRWR